ncbi:PDZ domain-containing protein 8-like [Haemaphysalis longicornis]
MKYHDMEIDIFISLDYAGGVTLAVDAELIIGGGQASLSLKVSHFSAKGRIQFSRRPYTRWSFAFYEEPKIVVSVESSLQGSSLPQIANIISSTIKRTLRTKHTLPCYKIRIKPFVLLPEIRFAPPQQEKISHTGQLEVTVVECSRLVLCEGSFQLYCMVSIEDTQWINVDKIVGTSWIPIQLEIYKERGQASGVEFKEKLIEGKFRQCIVVDSISPNSPFASGGLVEGDIVISIKGTEITDLKTAYKLLAKHGDTITMKVERKSEFKWHKQQQAPVEQQGQTHKPTDATVVPAGSVIEEPKGGKNKFFTSKTSLAALLGATKVVRVGDSEDIQARAKDKNQPIERTQFVLSTRDPVFLEKFTFDIKNNLKYINIGIFSKGQIISLHGVKKRPSDTMLAYVSDLEDAFHFQNSIPLTYVLDQCQQTTQGFFGPVIKLLCPEFQQLPKDLVKYSTLNGFDPRLCYGDITLHFVFKGEYTFKGSTEQDIEEIHDIMGLESSMTSTTLKIQAPKNLSHNFDEVTLKKIIPCNYCDYRIWLGSGCRCKACRMIVHNKCVAQAVQKTLCKQKMWTDEDAVEDEKEDREAKPAAAPVNTETSREFLRRLELNEAGTDLSTVLKMVASKQVGMGTFGLAVNEASNIHADLPPDTRLERVRNGYHKVKAEYESEKSKRDDLAAQVKAVKNPRMSLVSALAASEERLKALNLILLYYASGLKHLYEQQQGDETQ